MRTVKNRRIGSQIAVGRSADFDLEPEGSATSRTGINDWWTICDSHGMLASHSTRRLAESFVAAPWEWCEECERALMGLPTTDRMAS